MPMSSPQTWKIIVDAAADQVARVEQALAAALGEEAATIASFEIDDKGRLWSVEAYTWVSPSPDGIAQNLSPLDLSARIEQLPDADWVANSLRLLAPVRVGRFFVHGSHDADKAPTAALALCIEAAQAFGSGNHETTQACLAALNWLGPRLRPGRIWDVGSGTGILAIAAAKLWRWAKVLATDIDPIAVRIARDNAIKNGVAAAPRPTICGRIAHQVATGVRAPGAAAVDLMIANILLNPLLALAPAMAAAIRPGGVAVLSGILEKQEAALCAAYGRQGFRLLKRLRRNGWSALVLERT